MPKRKLMQSVAALAIALTFACSLIPTNPTPNQPTGSSAVQTSFDEGKLTDATGTVSFEDTSGVGITVKITDGTSNAAVKGIQVQVLSSGTDVAVIAIDPARVYFPTWEVIKPTSSKDGFTYVGFGVSSVQAQDYLGVALKLTKYYSWIEAGKSVYDYYKDKHDIRNFTGDSVDQCFTGPQLAKFFELNVNVALAILPLPPEISDPKVKEIVEALWTTVSTSAQIDASLYLQSLPDAYLFRFHLVRRPKFTGAKEFVLSLMPFEYLGTCEPQTATEPPQPTATPSAIVPPTVTFTPIPANPTIILNQTSNCREGPSTAYEVVYSFPAGTQFEIIGKYGVGWWLVPIDLPITRKKSCWIYEEGNTIMGDLNGVPNVQPSPLPPTEAPAPSGELPIYDFYSQTIIDYVSCDDAAKYEWEKGVWSETGDSVYFANGLYGNNTANGVYEKDAKGICGW